MFNIYKVKDQYGQVHLLRPKKIYKKADLELEKNPYDWNLPITELAKVCKNEKFSHKYSYKIQVKILNFYSMLMYSNDNCIDIVELNEAYAIYNRLHNLDDENIKMACQKFLNSYLEYIVSSANVDKMIKKTKFFRETCKKWIKIHFDNLSLQERIDFNSLKPMLINNFKILVKILDENNLFKKEVDSLEKTKTLKK